GPELLGASAPAVDEVDGGAVAPGPGGQRPRAHPRGNGSGRRGQCIPGPARTRRTEEERLRPAAVQARRAGLAEGAAAPEERNPVSIVRAIAGRRRATARSCGGLPGRLPAGPLAHIVLLVACVVRPRFARRRLTAAVRGRRAAVSSPSPARRARASA